MKRIIAILATCMLVLGATSSFAETLEQKIDRLEKELAEITSRVEKNEKHTATDRIQWYGDMRTKADSVHYEDIYQNMGMLVDFAQFGADTMGGSFGDPNDPNSPIAKMMAKYPALAAAFMSGSLPAKGMFGEGVKKYDLTNDILYTTRLRLGMKSKVADNVSFSGRLSMYKNWGDSTGVKVFDSWNSYTMDGTNGGNTSGDLVHVERAYFDWKDIGGSNFYLSIGRRPSAYGPPSQYRENEMRGGTPSGHLVHFNFDGITAGYKLSDITGVEGQTLRFCYGQGFESEYGNGELFGDTVTEDTQLGGFNFDALNDGTNFLQFILFHAVDVTDGFKGTLAIPDQFLGMPGLDPAFATVPNAFPGFNFVTRMQPRANIGDITLGGAGFAREEMNGVNWFTSFGWTHTKPTDEFGPFGGLLYDAAPVMQVSDIDADGNVTLTPTGEYQYFGKKERNGYSIYAGVQIPVSSGKIGLEYNWGSKFWTPFTQAQDDVIGSKLATRGHVGEAYYVYDVNPKMFIKLGGIYYDYAFTGSGSPVGLPQKVSDVKKGEAYSMLPVVDTAWDAYASLTVKF